MLMHTDEATTGQEELFYNDISYPAYETIMEEQEYYNYEYQDYEDYPTLDTGDPCVTKLPFWTMVSKY